MYYKNSRGRNYRKQGQMLTLVEYVMLLYRVLLPTPVWYHFFLNKDYGSLFSSLMTGLLGMSKECRNSGAFKWAASLLEDACKVAEASIQSARNSSCTWKLHGDILLTYAQVFPWTDESQSLEYNAETFKKSIYSWKNTCCVAAISARNSFQRALHLAPWQANIYVDIAISSNLISSFNEDYALDNTWKLPEKLTLGDLALEGKNLPFVQGVG